MPGPVVVTWTVTIMPPGAQTPLNTANALVAAIAATNPNAPGNAGDFLAAVASQNNAVFGTARRSADVLISDPLGGTVTVSSF